MTFIPLKDKLAQYNRPVFCDNKVGRSGQVIHPDNPSIPPAQVVLRKLKNGLIAFVAGNVLGHKFLAHVFGHRLISGGKNIVVMSEQTLMDYCFQLWEMLDGQDLLVTYPERQDWHHKYGG